MPLTGFQVGNTCYETAVEAANAFFSAKEVQVIVLPTGTVQEVDFLYNSATETWNIRLTNLLDGGARFVTHLSTMPQSSNAFPPCDPTQALNAIDFALAFNWGFGLVFGLGMLGYAISVVLQTIKKIPA